MRERPVLELLKLMQNKLDTYFSSGLCGMLNEMGYHKEITLKEEKILRYLLDNNPPYNTLFWRVFIKDRGFYWKAEWKWPRRQWIKRMIKRYQLN